MCATICHSVFFNTTTRCHQRHEIFIKKRILIDIHSMYDFSSSSHCFNSVSISKGVEDQYQHGRGLALADFNGDGKTDIVYGNWNGPHRLYLQGSDSKFQVRNRMVEEKISDKSL